MKKYFQYTAIPAQDGTVVTLGNFDGFHRGHQKIVRHTVATAQAKDLKALVITFHPHPRQLLAGDLPVLTPMESKIRLLSETGTDILLVQPFTKTFAAQDPRFFLESVLFSNLLCRHLVVGYDYSFGKAGAGNIELMKSVCEENGIGCDVIPPVSHQGEIISSTAVRTLLAEGNVQKAADYMGRPYSITGRVQAGAGRGKGLGFPTANLYPPPSAALPALGVYMVKARVRTGEYWGIANIGFHPTFPDNRLSLEVLLLEFTGDLYGAILEVLFFHRLRPEIKFVDGDDLRKQLDQDVKQVKALLNTNDVLKLQRILKP